MSFIALLPVVGSRELMIQRACHINPELSFCKSHITTAKIRSESEKKRDIFLRWAFVAAKDAQDIEEVDTEELETSRKKTYSVLDYCTKYKENFHTYCNNGNLEKLEGLLSQFCGSYVKNCNVNPDNIKLQESFPSPNSLPPKVFPTPQPISSKVFPTPQPLVDTSSSPPSEESGTGLCDAQRYKKECLKEGFTPESFCESYKKQCVSEKVTKIDDETTQKVDDSLETPEEFEEHETHRKEPLDEQIADKLEDKIEMKIEKKVEEAAEGQGSGTDEVTAYCTNYIENYNFYCVGDMLPEHGKFCDSYKKNCPDRVPLKQSGSFLGGDSDSESSSSSSSSGSDKTYLYKGTKKEYCQKFSVNYEYYCKGTIENAEIFTKFCPSYKRACVTDSPGAPANPFTASKGQKKVTETSGGDSDFPDFDRPSSGKSSGSRGSSGARKLKRRPCSADCDERIFPHCTKECKCDYDYPAVQKFCNPPPLPLFLNTCRLWYNGCPKYERYHYASQFIYSKAEKGKVLEGPKTQTTFQLLSPSGETLPYKPARRKRESGLVYWPEAEEEINSVEEFGVGNGTNVDVETDFGIDDNATTVQLQREAFESAATVDVKTVRYKNGTLVELVPAPPLPPKKNAKDQVLKDVPPKTETPDLPRVKKTTGGEAVPVYSDSVFSNALQQYNSLTDSRGILHRPRSRSPFTKPGLWEPNPDDPHNRDHANKYYYRPESVNVDWLQGQLAWGAHWAVPAAGVGGTDGFSAVHFPSIGTFLNIPDDYD